VILFDPADPIGDDFRAAVDRQLTDFLDAQHDLVGGLGDRLGLIGLQVRHFAAGGKRLRPAFCYWGYVAAAGQSGDPAGVLMVAASLDLLHAAALVHDDIIDGSACRRGAQSAHRFFAGIHAERGWRGSSQLFGRNAAILLGDLLLAGSVAMAERCQLGGGRSRRARPYLDAARIEVTAGQCLDLVSQTTGDAADPGEAALVMEYKTSKYTVTRPVQIGAALGLADEDKLSRLARFGSHLGHAYQLRDDLLGVFGDPAVTGKPAGDDLREGKRTALVAHALKRAESAEARRLAELLGDPALDEAGLAEARTILTQSGAVAATERDIGKEAVRALCLLNNLDLDPQGREALTQLTHLAVERTA
jgi:geranylgeranyl diphosphate synthase type I